MDFGEKVHFARLSVLAGGRTLEAIAAICDAEGDLPVDVLDGFASLVDKGLLKQEEGERAALCDARDHPRVRPREATGEWGGRRAKEAARRVLPSLGRGGRPGSGGSTAGSVGGTARGGAR
jgi:hypothetical protein